MTDQLSDQIISSKIKLRNKSKDYVLNFKKIEKFIKKEIAEIEILKNSSKSIIPEISYDELNLADSKIIENINAPVTDRDYTEAVTLINKGMAGSGNYRKFRVDTVTGQRYVHTVNPLTGLAEKSDVLSATVIANSCAEADAFATAFMALGYERAKEVLANVAGIDAYLLYTQTEADSVQQLFQLF